MLSCLIKPTSGKAFIDGYDIDKQDLQIKNIIGVCPQESGVALNLSVKDNLKLICEIYGFNKEKTSIKINELANQFDLTSVINKKVSKLSGGYKRRLSIAMALISEPKILFLDEPTLGLDVISRSELWDIITKLKGKITIILTTHYMEEAQVLSDKIAIMKNGRMLVVDTPNNIMALTNTNTVENAFISIVKGEL